ncbi:MAG: hypothetical protein IJ646_13025 [Clostridia bacterium]|nr:hypothetical protein [Clostridia bacterium]
MKKLLSLLLTLALLAGAFTAFAEGTVATTAEDRAAIEAGLDLANDPDQAWSYDAENDAWTLSVVSAVVYPVIPDEEGVSVCVPGAYVTGIDTDGDGAADVTADDYADTVNGSLVIDYEAEVTSTHGQVYTAATAPVILNTGAAGYGNSSNTLAASTYAKEGYINVSCGNRGKQDSATDASGETVYTGDAPSCLVDQKAAARFVKYNILLGNLPGSVDYWVSTGGSGGGAHAVMFAATSDNPDFYDYQIEVGAVGVYRNADGSYDTTVTIDGEQVELSDGAWGCVGYSPITSLYEADMAMAFEYTLDPTYTFNTDFQKAMAAALSREYMEYINAKGYVDENGEALTIEYDAGTGTYSGSYVEHYLNSFIGDLQDYLDSLDYADGWTWFDQDGNALSDEDLAAMTAADKAQAFLEGRYDKGSSGRGGRGGMMGDMGPSGMNGKMDFADGMPGGDGGFPGGGKPDGMPDDMGRGFDNDDVAANSAGDELDVGTPDQGTTQASGSTTDSKNYATYDDMLAAYEADIAEIEAGDRYGKNIVELYDPLNYIGAEGTEDPVWMVMLCGAAEGDISMLNAMNLEIAANMAGIDATAEWQWDGGHVPSEIFGSSLALRVDEMYGKYVSGTESVKSDADRQTANGTAESASGTDLTGWVSLDEDGQVSFALEDIAAYRTAAASKATPGFDVIDYGQEDYVFGDSDTDARHWSAWVYKALAENRDALEPLFNAD